MRLLGSLLLGLGVLGLAGCGKGSIQSPDFTSELVSLTVTPATGEVDEGEHLPLTAKGNYSTPPGSDSPTVERDVDGVSWTSSDPSIATVDENGVVTGVGKGDVIITAKKSGKTGTAAINAFAATLQSIVVSPDSATQPAGLPQQYTATGTFDNRAGGTETHDVTGQATWSVSNNPAGGTPIATIDPATGVATGLRAGSATVQAALKGQTDTADFIVTPPVLVSLDVQPDDPSAPLGSVVTFRAIGVFSNGQTQPLEATWTSSDPTVGAVTGDTTAKQDVQTLKKGSTTITATADNPDSADDLTGSSVLTVTNPALVSFARVEPLLGRVTVGRRLEYQAIGTYSDGEHPIPDSAVTWSIADIGTPAATPIGTIDADGVAVGVNIGAATVTATLNDPSIVSSGPASRNARLTVTDDVCTTPLLTSESATAVAEISPTCGGCTVANPENVINLVPDDFANISVPLALLGANAGVRVDAHTNLAYALPFPAGSNAGFLVSKPAGTLLTAELFSQIQIGTLLNGVEQEQTGTINPLRVDLLGQEVVNGNLYDTALVSIATSNDYDSIRLIFNSGTASALTNVLVGQACGTVELPAPAATLVGIEKLEPQAPNLLVGASLGFVAIGRYQAEDGSTVLSPIADADLDWSRVNHTDDAGTGEITVNNLGLVTGVTAGKAVVSATLKPEVTTSGAIRNATTEVTILPSACVTQFQESAGATAVGSHDPLCILCSVTEPTNAIDGSTTTSARLGVNLGLLMGSVSLTVTQAAGDDLQPGGIL